MNEQQKTQLQSITKQLDELFPQDSNHGYTLIVFENKSDTFTYDLSEITIKWPVEPLIIALRELADQLDAQTKDMLKRVPEFDPRKKI